MRQQNTQTITRFSVSTSSFLSDQNIMESHTFTSKALHSPPDTPHGKMPERNDFRIARQHTTPPGHITTVHHKNGKNHRRNKEKQSAHTTKWVSLFTSSRLPSLNNMERSTPRSKTLHSHPDTNHGSTAERKYYPVPHAGETQNRRSTSQYIETNTEQTITSYKTRKIKARQDQSLFLVVSLQLQHAKAHLRVFKTLHSQCILPVMSTPSTPDGLQGSRESAALHSSYPALRSASPPPSSSSSRSGSNL